MEDDASPHSAHYTSREKEKQGVAKLDWVSYSPGFNPIKRIWTLMKRRIQRRWALERVTTIAEIKLVLCEEWEKITVDEINREIEKTTYYYGLLPCCEWNQQLSCLTYIISSFFLLVLSALTSFLIHR